MTTIIYIMASIEKFPRLVIFVVFVFVVYSNRIHISS